MLYDILAELGVPTEQIEYVCQGEPRNNELEGHIVIHLKVLASTTLPEMHAF